MLWDIRHCFPEITEQFQQAWNAGERKQIAALPKCLGEGGLHAMALLEITLNLLRAFGLRVRSVRDTGYLVEAIPKASD